MSDTPTAATDDPRDIELADAIVREVAELPDRTSPDDEPNTLVVSDQELRDMLVAAFSGIRYQHNRAAAVAAAEIARLRSELVRKDEALKQIKEVCADNAAAACNHDLALKFVASVADNALTAG